MRRTTLLLGTMALAILLAGGVAQAATATFSNASPIKIVDFSPADPYPSQINVQNLSGCITDVDLKLGGFSHIYPDDVGVLVVGPEGQKVLVMSDSGFAFEVSDIDLTFDDEATSFLPDTSQITAGTYKPSQGTALPGEGFPVPANFPSPAPAGPYGTQLSVFDGTDPSGTWDLYVLSDSSVSTGQIADGWSLAITTSTTPCNREPAAVDDSFSTTEDTTLEVAAAQGVLANDTDADGDSLEVETLSGPSHGTLTLNDDGSFTYEPNPNFNGTDGFTYRASDGTADSNVATVTIAVNSANDAPDALDDAVPTGEDEAVAIDVLANDRDVDADTLSITGLSDPAHGTVVLDGGKINYTPARNYNGPDSFDYTVSDGNGGTDTATVNISVAPVNDAPVARDDAFTTREDTAATGNVLDNDTDIDSSGITAREVDGPSHGTLKLDADGSYTYTPDADYQGTDSFTYRASDGTLGSRTATVSITVKAVDDAPRIMVTAGSGSRSACLNGDTGRVTLELSDIDSDRLTLDARSSNEVLVPDGDVTFSGDGDTRTATMSARSGYAGSSTVTISVSDGRSSTSARVGVVAGTSASNALTGTSSSDVILARAGNDSAIGLAGNDLLCGGAGQDVLSGGAGDDTLSGGAGDDALLGVGGADYFVGGEGTDRAEDFDAQEGDTRVEIP